MLQPTHTRKACSVGASLIHGWRTLLYQPLFLERLTRQDLKTIPHLSELQYLHEKGLFGLKANSISQLLTELWGLYHTLTLLLTNYNKCVL